MEVTSVKPNTSEWRGKCNVQDLTLACPSDDPKATTNTGIDLALVYENPSSATQNQLVSLLHFKEQKKS
jgi:hypothetical protein